MKRGKALILAVSSIISLEASAGGLFTNNNQNPIFFRQPAQHAVIGVQGAYYNPAGVVFLNEGWHFYLGDQMALQSRSITSEYAPFEYGNGTASNKYEGSTFAPVIPSLDVVYNKDRWAASFHFGVVSGGGSCEFEEGLGSFEAPMALLPAAINSLTGSNMINKYDADIHFTGKSYGFGGQFNFAYKLIDNDNAKLALSAGIRGNYLKNIYAGGIFDYQLTTALGTLPASAVLTQVLQTLGMNPAVASAYAGQLGGDKEVDCTQNAFAFNPVLGAHFATGAWDFAVKYEFVTKVELENKTNINTAGIAQFDDGAKSNSDIPALLAGGFNVDILPNWRAAAGVNLYMDKSADYGGKQAKLGRNTYEIDLGTEYDFNSKWTASIGYQKTSFDFGENNDYLTDMSFSLSNWCLCGGIRYNINDTVAIDLSAFNTFYGKATKEYSDYGNAGATYAAALGQVGIPAQMLEGLKMKGKDTFFRTSTTFGIGVVWNL